MKVNYKVDLSRYNLVELEVFLDQGIITIEEFDAEKETRGLSYETVTPPEGRRPD